MSGGGGRVDARGRGLRAAAHVFHYRAPQLPGVPGGARRPALRVFAGVRRGGLLRGAHGGAAGDAMPRAHVLRRPLGHAAAVLHAPDHRPPGHGALPGRRHGLSV
uniref:Uncharacterized protein n=1 Tax=Human herpesvirus 2 TaxID=10310 RepID=A0A481TYL3_HHV2|nr:hypothetical protein [Human alphaherpesvirus 2]